MCACSSISPPNARRISRASSDWWRWSRWTKRNAKRAASAIASTRRAATPSRTTTSRGRMAEPVRDATVPVLTEVVTDVRRPRATIDAQALEALARELERAVLARLAPEVDRVIEEKLARTLSAVLGQALEGVRTELTTSVTQMVREAVAASVAHALRPDAQ